MTDRNLNLVRVERATQYIRDNLFQAIELKVVADNSYCSLYRFQRIFRKTTGFSLKEYIRKERMNSALYQLVAKDDSILQIALRQHYSSPEPFNRMFKKQYGLAPGKFRTTTNYIELHEGLPLLKPHFTNRFSEHIKNPRIIIKKEMKFAGYSIRTNADDGMNLIAGAERWREFWLKNSGDRITDKINHATYIGLVNNWAKDGWDYLLSAEVTSFENQPSDLICKTVPASKYIVFESNGLAPSIMDTWNDIVDYLDLGDYVVSPTHQMEIYGPNCPKEFFMPKWNFNNDAGYWRATHPHEEYRVKKGISMNIWIPVKHRYEVLGNQFKN